MYDDLHKSLGKPENRMLPDESFLTSDLAQADEGLLELWKSDGWSRYRDGLFWTVDPANSRACRTTGPSFPATRSCSPGTRSRTCIF
ncbi:GAD-like domain-containing protein [Nannocystis pusilla]|uniref:GAD-like domain-containing protein n=1 Tax=Nannocystis pusilla TaxID=889268 RepID=UPI003B76EFE0